MTADTSETINDEKSAESESEQESQEDKKACQLIIKKRMGRIARWLHLKFPRIFPDPWHKRILKDARQRDEQENIETSPPDDEKIIFQSLTIAEFYGPAQIDSLCTNLQRLELHEHEIGDRNAIEWIRRGRGNLTSGGWYSLGVLTHHEDRRFFPQKKVIELPWEVDYAIAEISCLTPAITCMVVTFIYKDEYALSFDNAIRNKYETTLTKIKRSYRINSPRFAKQDKINAIRSEAAHKASCWMSKNIPGMYSGKLLDDRHPVLELVTLTKAMPFPEKQLDYLDAMDLNSNREIWRSGEIDSLTFVQLGTKEPGRLRACLAANISSFKSIDMSTWGGYTRYGYINYISNYTGLGSLMSRWGLLALTQSFDKTLHIFRDEMFVQTKKKAAASRSIELISEFIKSDFDRALISRDIEHLTKKIGLFLHNLPEFKCTEKFFGQHDRKLAQSLREELEVRSQTLLATNQAMSSLISQTGSILSASESIRLQHRVERMTWIMLFLTLFATFAAIISVRDFVGKLISELSSSKVVQESILSIPAHSAQSPHKQ